MWAPLPPGCKLFWMTVRVVQRQEAVGEEGMGGGTEPALSYRGSGRSGCCWHCPQGWVMGQNQRQRQACNARLFPAPGMTTGAQVCFMISTFASWLGKWRKKVQEWKIAGVPVTAPRKPKPVSLLQPPRLPQHPVPAAKPCSPLPLVSPGWKGPARVRTLPARLRLGSSAAPHSPMAIPWQQAGTYITVVCGSHPWG